MFQRVLIANRGEIACRIVETCRRLGVASVAVYSEADAEARHVRMADARVAIGPAAAAESYLDIERIVAAARESRAEAVHPGYGFLSENAAFASAVEAAGLAFVGPPAEVIERMGSKRAAKALMEDAGVPVIPGTAGQRDDAALEDAARRIGFPVLVKASAGGGGKGMRIVREPGELAAALAAARREALSAFGDDELILEKYLERPRHVEVQVFGDHHGNLVHLFERECSAQRRHQKILEESPAPGLATAEREALHAAGLAAARAVGYRNAGTVELLLERGGDFYFLEMNTRLQVEHPVTEATTGVDLVEWQLRVAAGERLPLGQEAIAQRGHAIEARIYAEDPGRGFMPASGTVERFLWPQGDPAVRMDTGIGDGDAVTPYYDPMLAKLVVHGSDREAALAHLTDALAGTVLFGPANNLDFLRRLVASPEFRRGEMDTGLVERRLDTLLEPEPPPPEAWRAAALAVLAAGQPCAAGGDPWARRDAWRLQPDTGMTVQLSHGGRSERLTVRGGGRRLRVLHTGEAADFERLGEDAGRGDPGGNGPGGPGGWSGQGSQGGQSGWLRLAPAARGAGVGAEILAFAGERRVQVVTEDAAWEFARDDPWAYETPRTEDDIHPTAPMPGTVVAVAVAEGERVSRGDTLLVMEGMKMEFTLKAAADGVVEKLHVDPGDVVAAEAPLVDLA